MPYIIQSTQLQFLSGVHITPDYKHTLYFSSAETRDNFFSTLVIDTASALSYQRVTDGVIRVKIDDYNLITTANYLRFRNANVENKWYYAFIDRIVYVNNITYEIYYTLDVITTYLPDITIQQSFVVREHSAEDHVGDNLVTENLDIGDYIIAQQTSTHYTDSSQWAIVIASSTDGSTENTPVDGALYNGIYSGVKYTAYLNVEAVNTEIKNYTKNGTSDAIIGIFMIPLIDSTVPSFTTPMHKTVSIPKPATIDGYTPRNKKLLTYPFNAILINNQQGNVGVFRQEFFSGEQCTFYYDAMFSMQSEIAMTPVNYKRINGAAYDERVSITSMPFCAYTIDSYRAYLAQSRSSLAVSALSTVTTGAISALTGNAIGIVGTAGSIANIMARQEDFKRKPPQANGSPSADLLWALNAFDFLIQQQSITSGSAARLDRYFDAYGYATNRVKIPNISSRPHWNYIQTRDCCIVGNIPAADKNKIISIFDNGITFWKSNAEIGNYSLDNSPS